MELELSLSQSKADFLKGSELSHHGRGDSAES